LNSFLSDARYTRGEELNILGQRENDHSLYEWIACGKHKILQKTLKGPWKEE
jgi:hypothetical protein